MKYTTANTNKIALCSAEDVEIAQRRRLMTASELAEVSSYLFSKLFDYWVETLETRPFARQAQHPTPFLEERIARPTPDRQLLRSFLLQVFKREKLDA